jgi:hypothetical protein
VDREDPGEEKRSLATCWRASRIAILATDGVERRELQDPRDAVHQVGGDTGVPGVHQ